MTPSRIAELQPLERFDRIGESRPVADRIREGRHLGNDRRDRVVGGHLADAAPEDLAVAQVRAALEPRFDPGECLEQLVVGRIDGAGRQDPAQAGEDAGLPVDERAVAVEGQCLELPVVEIGHRRSVPPVDGMMRDDGSGRVEPATRNRHDGDDVSTQVPMEAPSHPVEVPQWLEAYVSPSRSACWPPWSSEPERSSPTAATARSSTRGSSASPNPPVTVIVGVNGAGARVGDRRAAARSCSPTAGSTSTIEHLVFVSGANAGKNTGPTGRVAVVCNGDATPATSSIPTSSRSPSPMATPSSTGASGAAQPVLRTGHLLHQRRQAAWFAVSG